MSLARSTFVVMSAMALLASACSDEPEPGGAAGGGEPEAEESTVTVGDSDLGEIVVDGEGATLYVFLADQGGESTCYDDCEANWPPLTVDGEPVAGEGVDGSLLGTAPREDGSSQVTLDGQPLYYFAADEAVGDTNGQGVGDVWFVVSPDGEPIQA